ncbi:MAG: histidine kinase dimerization/phospho-acceptor domain-containing protein [Cellulosilyticaceae bacterium]
MKRYTKQHLELLLDLIPYSVYLYDQTGEPIYSNRRGVEVRKVNVGPNRSFTSIMREDYERKKHSLLANKSAAGIVNVKMNGAEQYVQGYLAPMIGEQGQMKYVCAIYMRIYNDQVIEKVIYPYYKQVKDFNANQLPEKQLYRAQKVLAHILKHTFAKYRYQVVWHGEIDDSEGKLSSAIQLPPRVLSLCRKLLRENSQMTVRTLDEGFSQDQLLMEKGIKAIGIYPLRVDGQLVSTLIIGYESTGFEGYKEQYNALRICNQMEYYVKMLVLINVLKQEIELIEKIEKERQTFIDAEDQILCTTKWHGGFLEINRGFEQVLGYNLEQLTHMKLKDFLKEVEYYEINDQHVIVEHGHIRTSDGTDKWLSWNIVHKVVDGKSLIIASARDVTDQIEEEKRYNEDVRRLEKEKNKSALYATLSHELKTPLNIMLASCEMLRKNGGSEQKLVERIELKSYMMLKQVNDVIDLTKIGAGCFKIYLKKYNFVEVVESVIEVISEYLGAEGERIIFDTMEEELVAAFDREVVERITFNLIGDALDMARSDAKIQVTLVVGMPTQVSIRFEAKQQFLKDEMEIPSILDALMKLSQMTLSWSRDGSSIVMCVNIGMEFIAYPYCIPDDEQRLRNMQKCKIELAYLYHKGEPKCS